MKNVIYLTLVLLCLSPVLKGQEQVYPPRWGVKTNLLYWVTTTPNLSVEYAVNNYITLDLAGSYNPWQFGDKEENKKVKHWLIQPELRFWPCEKFRGSFWGVHAHYGRYNAGGVKLPLRLYPGLKDHRYEGYLIGAGISYGYQWYLSPRWNLEAQFSFGYTYLHYERYECQRCGSFKDKGHKTYLGPTKIGLSVVYLF